MNTKTKCAIAALTALLAIDFAAPAMAQNLCINKPATSLVDSADDDAEAMQRIEALGNRCYRTTVSGRRVTQGLAQDFLQTDPDQRDQQYGGNRLVRPQ